MFQLFFHLWPEQVQQSLVGKIATILGENSLNSSEFRASWDSAKSTHSSVKKFIW